MRIRLTLEVDVDQDSLNKPRSPNLSPAEVWLDDYDLLWQVKGHNHLGELDGPDQHITLVGFELIIC